MRKNQGMGCEGACAHAHVRCAVARVRAKIILKRVCDVRACGSFLSVRCATAFFHTFKDEMTRFHVLDRLFMF